MPRGNSDIFRRFTHAVTEATGSVWAFLTAVLLVASWLISGPMFGFSDTWQLVINTGTTIVTFLMVFAIQTSQNRESTALHLKIDELIREGVVTDQAGLSRLGHVTRARLTQIMNLLSLAPDIQEQLLFLPSLARGRNLITERVLRPIAAAPSWACPPRHRC